MNETKTDMNKTMQQLFPEPDASPTLHTRLEKLAEKTDQRRSRVRTVRRAVLATALVGVAVLGTLAAPRVALAVQLLDAARLLEGGRGIITQDLRMGKDGVLKAIRTTWATDSAQRREEGGKLTLWKDGKLYSWTPESKSVMVRRGDAPLGLSASQMLRVMAFQSCMDLVRREKAIQVDAIREITEDGRKLRRVEMSRGAGESGAIYFDTQTSLPVRIDTLEKDGKVFERNTFSVEPIALELLTLPKDRPILDTDQAESDFLAKLPDPALAKSESVTIYDAAIAPNGDLFLLYSEISPIVNNEVGMIQNIANFEIPGYSYLESKSSEHRENHLKVVVLTPANDGPAPIDPSSKHLKVMLKIPDSYEPVPIKELHGMPKYHNVALRVPLRRLTTGAPEYTELPMLALDTESAEYARRRTGTRMDIRFFDALKRNDFSEALRLNDEILAFGGTPANPIAQAWNQRSYVLSKLGRPVAEVKAAQEEFRKLQR